MPRKNYGGTGTGGGSNEMNAGQQDEYSAMAAESAAAESAMAAESAASAAADAADAATAAAAATVAEAATMDRLLSTLDQVFATYLYRTQVQVGQAPGQALEPATFDQATQDAVNQFKDIVSRLRFQFPV